MTNLLWLQEWFTKQYFKNSGSICDIKIITIKKSGWQVEINLDKTEYSQLKLNKLYKKKSDFDWFSIEIKNKKYKAEGDPTKLNLLIGEFRGLLGKGADRYISKTDNFFSAAIQNFIFENDKELRIFMHYTKEEDIAKSIINKGFEFAFTFDRTATVIVDDYVDLVYKHDRRKPFGDYVIIICISKKIYASYLDELNKIISNDSTVPELLTETPVYINEDSEKVYTLNKKFIKGYFHFSEGKIEKNPDYNPYYDSEIFRNNLNRLKV